MNKNEMNLGQGMGAVAVMILGAPALGALGGCVLGAAHSGVMHWFEPVRAFRSVSFVDALMGGAISGAEFGAMMFGLLGALGALFVAGDFASACARSKAGKWFGGMLGAALAGAPSGAMMGALIEFIGMGNGAGPAAGAARGAAAFMMIGLVLGGIVGIARACPPAPQKAQG